MVLPATVWGVEWTVLFVSAAPTPAVGDADDLAGEVLREKGGSGNGCQEE